MNEPLNGVLHRFQQYFSDITATARIIHVFPGLNSTRLGLQSVLPKDTPMKNPEDPKPLKLRIPGSVFTNHS